MSSLNNLSTHLHCCKAQMKVKNQNYTVKNSMIYSNREIWPKCMLFVRANMVNGLCLCFLLAFLGSVLLGQRQLMLKKSNGNMCSKFSTGKCNSKCFLCWENDRMNVTCFPPSFLLATSSNNYWTEEQAPF